MAPRRSKKQKPPPTPTPDTTETATATTTAVSKRIAWKTGEQLEYLLSQWSTFLAHQNEGKLERFWPHVYQYWNKKWAITPTAESLEQHGSDSAAILALRGERSTVRIANSYPRVPSYSYLD
jgi:hypothetical protein